MISLLVESTADRYEGGGKCSDFHVSICSSKSFNHTNLAAIIEATFTRRLTHRLYLKTSDKITAKLAIDECCANKTFQIFAYFQVAGIALIVAGAIPLFKLEDIRDAFPENNPAILPIAVLVLGSVIFTISFFGCCGAIRESQCMVTTVSLLKSLRSSSMINFCHQLVCLLLAGAGHLANRHRSLRFHVH